MREKPTSATASYIFAAVEFIGGAILLYEWQVIDSAVAGRIFIFCAWACAILQLFPLLPIALGADLPKTIGCVNTAPVQIVDIIPKAVFIVVLVGIGDILLPSFMLAGVVVSIGIHGQYDENGVLKETSHA